MNIVFYVLIALALAILYFALSSVFKYVGEFAIKVVEEFKNNISDKEGEDENGKE